MTNIEELISHIPLADLAAKLGVDEATASQVVGNALPALLAGLKANAESGGEKALEAALATHSPKLIEQGVEFDSVDAEDGKKIVKHALGKSEREVAVALGQKPGLQTAELITNALPMLAPIVMSFLAQKKSVTNDTSSNGLGDLLGALLGNAAPAGKQGGLTGVLEGLGALFRGK